MTQTQRSDATPMMRAAIYQLCVALERCYRLAPGQSVYIEQMGDVSISGKEQTEVKHYTSPLTDNHPNFWNTLYNWTEPNAQAAAYQFLILHTTQQFGARSRLVDFNGLEVAARMKLLRDIHADLEADYAQRNQVTPVPPSATLRQQRLLLAGERSAHLEALLGKVSIEARCPYISELYEELCRERAGHVLDGNVRTYIDALIGFVCKADMAAGESWVISYEDFKVHYQYLTGIYCAESRKFPRAELDRALRHHYSERREDLFIRKIVDIGADSAIVTRSIREYEGTIDTIAQEFRHHTSTMIQLGEFEDEVVTVFQLEHRYACLEKEQDEHSSMRFFLKTVASKPPEFPGYADSPLGFRNGVLHMTMNEEHKDCCWKVGEK